MFTKYKKKRFKGTLLSDIKALNREHQTQIGISCRHIAESGFAQISLFDLSRIMETQTRLHVKVNKRLLNF